MIFSYSPCIFNINENGKNDNLIMKRRNSHERLHKTTNQNNVQRLQPKRTGYRRLYFRNPSKVSHSPISNLASELGIADSTFFQFTKNLGYNGFKDFKMAMLIQENDLSAISIHENIQKTDTELTMAQKVFESSISTLMTQKSCYNKRI